MAVDYSQSEQDRELLIRQRQRNTARAFEEMRKKIDEQIATMNMSTVSERAKRQQLEEIRDQLQKSLGAYYSDLEDGLKSDMISIGESVLSDSEAFYNSLNMPLSIGITSFPVEIMENVINGSVYGEKWFLSGALWGDYQSKLDDINTVIAEGIGLNKPIYEIAKDLEKYVDPNARKDWAWSKVYPGTAKTVDYNAQRLARTLISHAYQQNVVRQAQANPFATGVKWEASGGERMCEICEERDGKIFPVDDVPLDHPNGMCTFAVETPSMKEMSDTLADWVNGEPTDWDDQLNAYYEGRPIDHKSTANASGKEEVEKVVSKNINDYSYLSAQQLEELNESMPLSQDDYDAIYGENGYRGYIGTSNSYKINLALRNDDMSLLNEKSHDSDLKTIDALQRAAKNGVLTKDIKAIRMVGRNGGYLKTVFGLNDEQVQSLMQNPALYVDALQGFIGTKIKEKGFMSVSVNPDDNLFGTRSVRLNLLCPAGTHGYATENADESEIILPYGTKYEIVSIQKGENEWGRDILKITAIVSN